MLISGDNPVLIEISIYILLTLKIVKISHQDRLLSIKKEKLRRPLTTNNVDTMLIYRFQIFSHTG